MADIQFEVTLDGIAGFVNNIGKINNSVEGMVAGVEQAIGAFNKFASFMGGFVDSADEAAMVEAQLAAGIKSTGGAAGLTQEALIDLAESLAEVTLFEDDVIKSSEALLLTFTSIGKDIFPQAEKAALNLATKFGGDLKGSTIQLGKALQDPIAGISALHRVGVDFSEAQKLQIKNFVETNQLAKAQGVILAELDKEVGGAAEAAAAAGAGSWKQFKKAIGEAGETVGKILIPVLNFLGTVLKPFAPIIVPIVAAVGLLTLGFIALNSAAVMAVIPILTMAAPFIAIGAAIGALVIIVIKVVKWFDNLSTAAKVVGIAVLALAAPFIGVGLAVAGVVGGVISLVKSFFDAKPAIEATGQALIENKKRWAEVKEQINSAGDAFLRYLSIIDQGQKEDAFVDFNRRVKAGTASISEMNDEIDRLTKRFDKLIGTSPESAKSDAERIRMLKAQIKLQEDFKKGLLEGAPEVKLDRGALFEDFKAELADRTKAQNDLNESVEHGNKFLDDLFASEHTSGTVAGPDKNPFELTKESVKELNGELKLGEEDVIPGWTKALQKSGKGVNFMEGNLDSLYLKLLEIKEAFTELGKAITANVAHAFGDLAFNLGNAIALGQDLRVVMKNFIADMIASVGKMIGVALINMALGAGFPLGIPFLIAGLAVLGLSGLLSGSVRKDRKADKGGTPDLSQGQSQRPDNAPGLSSFNEDGFNPTINIDAPVQLEMDGRSFRAHMRTIENQDRRARGN